MASPATDPYYASTIMLMGGEQRGGTGYSNFVDESGNGFNPTRVGLAGQGAKVPNSSFAGSMVANNATDYITNASISFGSNNFSYETWVFPRSPTTGSWSIMGSAISELGAGSWMLYVAASTNYLTLYSASTLIGTTTAMPYNTWTHIAVTRIGNVFTLYMNGSSIGTATIARTFTGSTVPLNHSWGSVINGCVGYYANTRLVIGSSAYSANFTAPTTPVTAITNTKWLLNFANGVVVDKSAKNYGLNPVGTESLSSSVVKYGAGSVYFDGATSYTVVPTIATQFNWATLTGGFTIEAWVYPTTLGGSVRPIVSQSTSTTTNEWEFIWNTSSQLQFRYWTGAARSVIDVGATVPINTWTHVAMTFDGSNVRIFVNGVLKVTTAYIAAQVSGLVNLVIGAAGGGQEGGVIAYYAGYMDDLRITTVCRYTGNFTPLTYAAPSA